MVLRHPGLIASTQVHEAQILSACSFHKWDMEMTNRNGYAQSRQSEGTR